MEFHHVTSKFAKLVHMGLLLLPLLMEHTQARIGYFWHITDLHLDTIYSTQGDVMRSCWRIERQSPSSAHRSPGRFGDYLCDSPWNLIDSAAKAMKSRQGDNVEFVLWTGDGLSHSAHPLFETKKLEILRNITDLLGRTFSSQFVFPVLGHEDGTTTNFRHMGELWRHWLPSEALHTFEKGGYYSIEQTKSRLRIIALNTNFMRHDPKYSQSHLAAVRQRTPPNTMMGSPETPEYKNYYYHHGTVHQHHGHASDWSGHGYSYNGHHRGIPGIGVGAVDGSGGRVSALSEYENQDTEKQWIWLEDVLSKSKNNKETVYIVGHIPPGSDERHIGLQQNGHTTFTESNNKRYLELVRKYSSIIQGQFFGHLHSDSFRIIYDDKGKPVSWMMISPSVTPRKMSVGSNNPAMRLYKFDTDSGQVLDYTQYYMDLQLANTLGEPNWVPEYNLTHYYALSDISAISLHNFVDRFTGNDGSWFAKYYRANAVRYQTDPCEGVCMLNHYCAITRVDYKEFRQCLEKEQSALRSHGQPLLSSACPLLVLVCTLTVSCFRTFLTILPKIIAHLQGTQKARQIKLHDAMGTMKIKTGICTLMMGFLELLQHIYRFAVKKPAPASKQKAPKSCVEEETKFRDDCMQHRSVTMTMQPEEDFICVIPFGHANKSAFNIVGIVLRYKGNTTKDHVTTKRSNTATATETATVITTTATVLTTCAANAMNNCSVFDAGRRATAAAPSRWQRMLKLMVQYCRNLIFAQCQTIFYLAYFVASLIFIYSYLPLKLHTVLTMVSQHMRQHVCNWH